MKFTIETATKLKGRKKSIDAISSWWLFHQSRSFYQSWPWSSCQLHQFQQKWRDTWVSLVGHLAFRRWLLAIRKRRESEPQYHALAKGLDLLLCQLLLEYHPTEQPLNKYKLKLQRISRGITARANLNLLRNFIFFLAFRTKINTGTSLTIVYQLTWTSRPSVRLEIYKVFLYNQERIIYYSLK